MLHFPRWKITVILAVCLLGFLSALPNFLPEDRLKDIPGWLPSRQVSLGLDLQGGSHMLLEVGVQTVIDERLDTLQDDVRIALRRERIGYTGLIIRDGEVSFRLRDAADEDKALKVVRDLAQPVSSNLSVVPADDIEIELRDDGKIAVRPSEQGAAELKRRAVQQSIEIVRRRVDELGTREPTIQSQGDVRILVQVPGLDDPQDLIDMLGKVAKMSFHLVDETTSASDIARGRVAPGSVVYPSADDGGAPLAVRRRAMVSGENLVDARPSFDQQSGIPVVTFRFDVTGARKFGNATKANVGRRFAIVLDNEIISAPVIREPITGGRGQISGSFTVKSANNLSILLRAGALPAPLIIKEQRSVGPDLGADSIAAGKMAAIFGLTAVVIFIILSYGLFGVAANIALFVNLILILGALSVLQATLTLPGIAGIVLTIGMAVDANVLVFERIREEIKLGKAPFAAVDNGYSQAMSTIMDANITTLIAAIILFQYGSGPIRGFAVTLSIGIVASVFTAVTVTRLMLTIWLRRTRPTELVV